MTMFPAPSGLTFTVKLIEGFAQHIEWPHTSSSAKEFTGNIRKIHIKLNRKALKILLTITSISLQVSIVVISELKL